MGKKVLVVLTSVGKIPGTDKETGWYLVRPPPSPSVPDLSVHGTDQRTPDPPHSPPCPGPL